MPKQYVSKSNKNNKYIGYLLSLLCLTCQHLTMDCRNERNEPWNHSQIVQAVRRRCRVPTDRRSCPHRLSRCRAQCPRPCTSHTDGTPDTWSGTSEIAKLQKKNLSLMKIFKFYFYLYIRFYDYVIFLCYRVFGGDCPQYP